MSIRQLSVLSSALLFVGGAAAAQGVFVVDDDGGPGVDFTTIQAGIDGVPDGSVLLVKEGFYLPFQIDGRSLDVVADTDAVVSVSPIATVQETSISNVGPGQRVVLKGLTHLKSQPGIGFVSPAISITDCSGLVWLQGLEVQTEFNPFAAHDGQQAAGIFTNSGPIVIQGTRLVGATGVSLPPIIQGTEVGARSMIATNSEIHVFESSLSGGGTTVAAGLGQNGVELTDSFLALHGSFITGGPGGDSSSPFTTIVGDGGTGLVLEGDSEVWSIGTSIAGGSGGTNGLGVFGDPGEPLSIGGTSTIEEVSVPDVEFTASPVVRDEDETVTTYTAGAGDLVFLLFNFTPGVIFSSDFPATSAVGLAPLVFPLPTIPLLGTYGITFGAPALPPGLDSFPYYLQVAYFKPAGVFVFSGPQIVHLIDDAF